MWPDMISSTNDEKATVALKKTEAIVKYIQGEGESLIDPIDYLTRIIGMTEEEAIEVVKNATEKIEEDIAEGIVPDPSVDVEMEQKLAEANLKTAQLPPIPPKSIGK